MDTAVRIESVPGMVIPRVSQFIRLPLDDGRSLATFDGYNGCSFRSQQGTNRLPSAIFTRVFRLLPVYDRHRR